MLAPQTTHDSLICSDEGLTVEMSVPESLYSDQITLPTLLINQTFVSTPHRRSTAVSSTKIDRISAHVFCQLFAVSENGRTSQLLFKTCLKILPRFGYEHCFDLTVYVFGSM